MQTVSKFQCRPCVSSKVMMELDSNFTHHQAAHCESGVISTLFRNAGQPLSKSMAFGIGSGIFFLHLPFVKVMELPLTSYRSFPGTIFKKACTRLGIKYEYHKFRDPVKGRTVLDRFAELRQPVGLQSNIYWLPYIPSQFRFQFNAHNLIVYGKDAEQNYLVSDPILEVTSLCDSRSLSKARFAKGPLSPKGLIYYPVIEQQVSDQQMAKGIRQGIDETVKRMLYTPLPFIGVKGIRYLSRQMDKWPSQLPDQDTLKLYIANVVRMQEEIGTGGAGFRFLYAAFLQESGERLDQPALLAAAKRMTATGNLWREFAVLAAKLCKDRLQTPYAEIPRLLLKIADEEQAVYRDLKDGLRGRYL